MPSLFLSLNNPLPEEIFLYGRRFNTVQLIRSIEQINRQKILTANNKVPRNLVNVTLELNIIKPSRMGEPLRIPTRNGNPIELYPKF